MELKITRFASAHPAKMHQIDEVIRVPNSCSAAAFFCKGGKEVYEIFFFELQAPNLAKVWYEFASWSLEMGEKVLASSINGCVPLTNEEEARLKAVNGLSQVQLKELTDVISQVHLKQIQTTAEIEVDKTEFMRKTLASTCFRPESGLLEKESLEVLLKLWQDVQKRIFYYQEVATSSYFTFISLSQGSGGKEQRVISATLRLLQLIVKHSFELQESLESLDQTPSHCW